MDSSTADSRDDESGPEIRCKKQKLTIVFKSKYTYCLIKTSHRRYVELVLYFVSPIYPYIRNHSKKYYIIGMFVFLNMYLLILFIIFEINKKIYILNSYK